MWTDACITKDNVDPVFAEISKSFNKGLYTKLRGIPVYKTDAEDGGVYYIAGGPDGEHKITIYGWVNISKVKRNWQCWSVDQSYVFPQVRGEGWGKLLYDTIINREGIMLASGNEQSRLGRRMWKTMIKSDRYTIWAHDFNNIKRFGDVVYNPEDDKIHSPIKIYQKYGWAEDIRLIAIKKRKSRAKTK